MSPLRVPIPVTPPPSHGPVDENDGGNDIARTTSGEREAMLLFSSHSVPSFGQVTKIVLAGCGVPLRHLSLEPDGIGWHGESALRAVCARNRVNWCVVDRAHGGHTTIPLICKLKHADMLHMAPTKCGMHHKPRLEN